MSKFCVTSSAVIIGLCSQFSLMLTVPTHFLERCFGFYQFISLSLLNITVMFTVKRYSSLPVLNCQSAGSLPKIPLFLGITVVASRCQQATLVCNWSKTFTFLVIHVASLEYWKSWFKQGRKYCQFERL